MNGKAGKKSKITVLGIYGSPRAGGNSDLLLDKVLQGAEEAGAEVRKLYVRELKFEGCRECGGCDETGECVWQDDMQKAYSLFDEAEVIVIATPIFFYAMPGKLKCLIDRGQAMWNRRRLRKPREKWKEYDSGRGYLIAVGATKGKNLFEGVELTARYFFDALDMEYGGGLFFREVDEKGAIRKVPAALDQAYEFGKSIIKRGS